MACAHLEKYVINETVLFIILPAGSKDLMKYFVVANSVALLLFRWHNNVVGRAYCNPSCCRGGGCYSS